MDWNEIFKIISLADYLLPKALAFIFGIVGFLKYIRKRINGTIPTPVDPFYKNKALIFVFAFLVIGWALEGSAAVIWIVLIVVPVGVMWPFIEKELLRIEDKGEGKEFISKSLYISGMIIILTLVLIFYSHGEELINDIVNIRKAL